MTPSGRETVMDDGKPKPEIDRGHALPQACAAADGEVQRDVQRMLAYATGARRITLDEETLRGAVAVTGAPIAALTPEERLALHRLHGRLAEAIAPATPDGLRTLEAYQHPTLRDRRSRAVFGASGWAVGGIALAMIVHAYVATGSLIVRSIEAARVDVEKVQGEIRGFDAAHPSNPVLGKDALVGNQSRENERRRLQAAAKSTDRRFDTVHDRLTSWLYLPLDTLGIKDLGCADDRLALEEWALRPGGAASASAVATRGALVRRCGESASRIASADEAQVAEAYYRARQAHEQNARAAMELFSVVVLPLVFGLLGASLAVLRDVNRRLHEGSLDLTTLRCAAMRRIMGAAVGGISGIFFTPTHVLENWGLSLVALAFLLGFSVDVAFRVFQRLADRLADALGGGETQKTEPPRR